MSGTESTKPKISIVTIVLNRRDFIQGAIENVIDQGYPNVEHIIVDGASTDGTLEIIRKYPHVRLVSERDSGSVFALNKGLRLIEGDIFGWLNSDERYKPGIFHKAVECFNEHPEWDLIHGTFEYIDRNGSPLGRSRLRPFNLHRQILGLNYIGAPSAMFMRKAALDGVGGLVDEQWRDAYDHDLWIRVGKKYKVQAVDACFSQFGLHPDSGMASDPLRSWREARKIRAFHGGDRAFLDRVFWIPYVEAKIKLFRFLKLQRMSAKASQVKGSH
jgi:glycosyltransferase involved in cell wall biosynthesis